MERCFNQHLVGADAVHSIEHPFPLPVHISFNPEGGKLVGYHAKAPPRGVWRGTVVPDSKDLGRGLVLVSFAERAEPTRRFMLFDHKIGGASSTFCGDDDPSSMNGIFSQLRRERSTS